MGLQLVNIKVFDALMLSEFSSGVFLVTNLTHNHYFWAVSLDMIVQLRSGHMLVLISIANIAAKLWAVELGVGLQLAESLPNDLILSI